MAVTTFPLIARSRTGFPRLGPSTGPIIRPFPSPDRHRPLTAPRRPGVGSPTIPERQGAHYASLDPAAPWSSRGPAEALVARAVDAALESLNNLERQAREVARAFRIAAADEARQGLVELVTAIEQLVTLASVTADACGTHLTALCEVTGLNAETETTSLMNQLLRHQRANDRLGLAATLDQCAATVLEQWRQVFFALDDPPTDPSGHAA
jgi:hypothetical protein